MNVITPQNIILLCWTIFIIYWAINWFHVKPSKEGRWGGVKFRFVAITIMVAVIFIAKRIGIQFSVLPPCHQTWYDCHYYIFNSHFSSETLQIIGVLLAAMGLIIAIVARYTLAGNWSATIDLKEGHELITKGIYNYIRHPIYTGILLMGLGTVLVSPSLSVLFFYLFLLVIFIFRIKKEEELMTKTFPKEYPEYKKKVKALIPYIL